jgi:hypothetical protein
LDAGDVKISDQVSVPRRGGNLEEFSIAHLDVRPALVQKLHDLEVAAGHGLAKRLARPRNINAVLVEVSQDVKVPCGGRGDGDRVVVGVKIGAMVVEESERLEVATCRGGHRGRLAVCGNVDGASVYEMSYDRQVTAVGCRPKSLCRGERWDASRVCGRESGGIMTRCEIRRLLMRAGSVGRLSPDPILEEGEHVRE